MDADRENRLLRGALEWRGKKRERTGRVGDIAKEYLGKRARRLKRNAEVVDALGEVLDSQFGEHCKLVSISGGVVRFEVEPGPYMHEMKLMSSELIEALKVKCPRAGLREIKIAAKNSDVGL